MRGSPQKAAEEAAKRGIIPAHAGLTVGLARHNRYIWDHPRACGAHIAAYPLSLCGEGSSPRMRGSRIDDIVQAVSVGIIPAHAGLTHYLL